MVTGFLLGTPEGTRTPSLQNRNLTLYPIALRAHLTRSFNVPDYYSNHPPVCKELILIFLKNFQSALIYTAPSSLEAVAVSKQRQIPSAVGMTTASTVHLTLRVSRAMVRQVVEHGQWNRENSMVHSAVVQVQPFTTNSSRRASRLPVSCKVPVDR